MTLNGYTALASVGNRPGNGVCIGFIYQSHALLKAKCRLLIRAPSVTHSDSFSIIMTGRQIPNPEAIAKDTQAAERLIRKITGMEQLEFDRWDYLVSHKSASVHPTRWYRQLNAFTQAASQDG
jgi:hypothetical protein